MRRRIIVTVAVLALAACGKKEHAEPSHKDEQAAAAPAFEAPGTAEEVAAAAAAAAAETDVPQPPPAPANAVEGSPPVEAVPAPAH